MKAEVAERIRVLAAGELPDELEGATGRRKPGTNEWQPHAELEQFLSTNDNAELARWLLELHDENEQQAEYTLRVLELVTRGARQP